MTIRFFSSLTMPAIAKSLSQRLNAYTQEFKCLSHDSKLLFCTICSTNISSEKRNSVIQHLRTKSHKPKQQRSLKSQQFISFATPGETSFFKENTSLLVSLDIPLHKLQNQKMKDFLQKYCKESVSVTSTRNCLKSLDKDKIGPWSPN